MATGAQWIQGARPRTLPAAVAPVLAGSGVALYGYDFCWWRALLALGVSLLLQVGVNYANDYSDGIRGTDDVRVGPLRLVGSGVAKPEAVKAAAFTCFGAAGVLGLALAVSTSWWLVLVGALSILAAWFYTGGKKPYGYLGLGEVMVFVFFGLVAVLGTVYVQVERLPGVAWAPAVGIGALACAILVANNLRDIPTDTLAGKRTLAVKLGDVWTRRLYSILAVVALLALVVLAHGTTVWAAIGLIGFVPLFKADVVVNRRRAVGPDLIPVLQLTGVGELLYALGLFVGLWIGR
ncbi:MAG TPA: 1,4-dihydroxy-2-naphthoate polyprenyltransferase [Marmoricola sp.]|jgi:1,4-dihydroxy-2-naphthoate octaprenyltransferase|nr:1,4-dihydroxy-2-naphthoate polyprenyltransferase [Marmoricola sp.]